MVRELTKKIGRRKAEQRDDDDDESGIIPDFESMFQRRMSEILLKKRILPFLTRVDEENHNEWLDSKRSLVQEKIGYATKEMVKTGALAIDEIKASVIKFRAQEIEYEKYHEDNQVALQRQDDGFRQLHANFSPILEDLGRTRADEINATCELIKNNPSHRQSMLRNFSKSMRSRLEEAKRKEKEIADAEALIEMVKKILYF